MSNWWHSLVGWTIQDVYTQNSGAHLPPAVDGCMLVLVKSGETRCVDLTAILEPGGCHLKPTDMGAQRTRTRMDALDKT